MSGTLSRPAPAAEELASLVPLALGALEAGAGRRGGPLPQGEPADVVAAVRDALDHDALPERGIGATAALATVVEAFAAGAADPADPACAAHLHCPPLAVAVAADLAASALNASLDSWDQGPAAIALEDEVVRALCGLCGLRPERAAGTMTSGGTASNLTALHLAREHAGGPVRIICSRDAHFSVARAAGVLGLGEEAVSTVAVDGHGRIDPRALGRALQACSRPAVVVATAGTTDLGSIDPLDACADLARAHGAWLHVDAAYGGGALFSARLRPLLQGIGGADSIGLDLHKLGWQPTAAGVLLVRDRDLLAPLERRVAYLNAADDHEAGYVSTLGRSLRTTRRADALKVAVTLRALGREGLGERVEACHRLARHAARRIAAEPRLVLVAEPVLTTVVFTVRGDDAVAARARRRLLRTGRGVVGRTERDGRVCLKLTLLQPQATPADVDQLLDAVVEAVEAVEAEGCG